MEAPASRASAFTAHLDVMRGIAALAVLVYHIRYKFFLDYADVPQRDAATWLFYVLTSFGHDAVMVFFVLSGFLITGTVLKDLRAGHWSWPRYLTNRLTRLYVVLIPGLLLTLAWDGLGLRAFGGHVAYTGAPQAWRHDFFDVASTTGAGTVIANIAFMQATGGVPPLGSNVPLWSLTFELAYYLLFPAMAIAIWPGVSAGRRGLHLLLAAALAYHFGQRVLLFFPVWLFGLAALAVPAPRWHLSSWIAALGGLAVVAAAAFRHTPQFTAATGSWSLEAGDYLVGAACAVVIWSWRLAAPGPPSPLYARLAAGIAAFSFTLYVVHMPFLIFVRAWVNPGPSWPLAPSTLLTAAALTAATLLYAVAVWALFERQTPLVRERVARLVLR